MIKHYAYAGTNFISDLDLPLPKRYQWGKLGKDLFFYNIPFVVVVVVLRLYILFCRH